MLSALENECLGCLTNVDSGTPMVELLRRYWMPVAGTTSRAENTLTFNHVPCRQEPFKQDKTPTWEARVKDPETGRWISSQVTNDDFIAWVGQGAICHRTKEV